VKRSVFIFLLSVFPLSLAGCGLKPGTEMMLNQKGADSVEGDRFVYQTSGWLDWHVSKGTKVRVIKHHHIIRVDFLNTPEEVEIYVLEGDARNHTFTVYRDCLVPIGGW